MLSDKLKVLIEHQDNSLFSICISENDKDWYRFFTDLGFKDAKYWVKIIRVAYTINQELNNSFVDFSNIFQADAIVRHNNLTDKTAKQMYVKVKAEWV